MVHFYTIDDGHGFRYLWGIEGDKGAADNFVASCVKSKAIRSYWYNNSKPADKLCTGTRNLGNGLTSKFCRHAYIFSTRRD